MADEPIGVDVVRNDPIAVPNHTARAVAMGMARRECMAELVETWQKRGHAPGFGVGIVVGEATLGTIGFEGQSDHAAIGLVCDLAARLCDRAAAVQIILSEWAYQGVADRVEVERVAELDLKGFAARAGLQRGATSA